MKGKKRALFTSGLCLGMSAALLAGATFAWFTDSVTNQGNTIQSGSLQVGFACKSLTGSDAYQAVPTQADQMGHLFVTENWEPGRSQGLDLKVTNDGTLALRYGLYFTNLAVQDGNDDQTDANLADVLDVYITDVNAPNLSGATYLGTLSQLEKGFVKGGRLVEQKAQDEFSVVLKMQEKAGNQYQDCTVSFDVELRATQTAHEMDGFGSADYDATADGTPDQEWGFVAGGSQTVTKGTESVTLSGVDGVRVTLPEQLPEGEYTMFVAPTKVPENVVAQGKEAQAYEITLKGLSENNAVPIPVQLFVGKGLTNVELYHGTQKVEDAVYHADTGYVDFRTTTFSPFTVTYQTAVAEVNGVGYATLEEAVQAAEDATVLLRSNAVVTRSMTIQEGQHVVLDLNGKCVTVSPDFSTRVFTNRGDLTIQGNGSIDVTNAGANGYGTVNNFGTLTVVDGTYTCLKEANASNFYNRNGGTATFINPTIHGGAGCVATEKNTTTTISGGVYEDEYYPAIENRGDMLITAGTFLNTSCSACTGKWGYTIRSGESSDTAYLKIQGEKDDSVKVTGVQGGLAVIGGTADIYNGVYETVACKVHTSGASSFYAGYFTGESYKTSTTIYGGTFRSVTKTAVLVGNGNPAPDSGAGKESTVVIKGGTFMGGDAAHTAISVNQAQYAIGAAKISGGVFSSDPVNYLAEGYVAQQNDGLWVVRVSSET